MLEEHCLPPLTGRKPERVIVFLHGYGENGSRNGFWKFLSSAWRTSLENCEFICPSAPLKCDAGKPGFDARQWFDVQNPSVEGILERLQIAVPIVNDYVQHVLQTRELSADRLAIIGFSQGAVMSLYAAPRRSESVACVIGYSGCFPFDANLVHEKKSSPPTLLVHGDDDHMAPYAFMGMTRELFQTASFDITAVTCPGLGHKIDDKGCAEGLKFIQAHLRPISSLCP